MKIVKIVEEKENPLFSRKEIKIIIESETIPKESEAEKIISQEFSSPEENIKIKKIVGRFGERKVQIDANIYKTKDSKESTERKPKKEKGAKTSEGEGK